MSESGALGNESSDAGASSIISGSGGDGGGDGGSMRRSAPGQDCMGIAVPCWALSPRASVRAVARVLEADGSLAVRVSGAVPLTDERRPGSGPGISARVMSGPPLDHCTQGGRLAEPRVVEGDRCTHLGRVRRRHVDRVTARSASARPHPPHCERTYSKNSYYCDSSAWQAPQRHWRDRDWDGRVWRNSNSLAAPKKPNRWQTPRG